MDIWNMVKNAMALVITMDYLLICSMPLPLVAAISIIFLTGIPIAFISLGMNVKEFPKSVLSFAITMPIC